MIGRTILISGCVPAALAGCAVQEATTGRLDRLPSGYWSVIEKHERMVEENSASEHFGITDTVWRKNRVTVAFNGGDAATYALIEEAANDWTVHSASFQFVFRDVNGNFLEWSDADTAPAADIRIGFEGGENGGYWSYVGTQAAAVDANLSTMNYEDFPQDLYKYRNGANSEEWRTSYHRSTILHEFGHALGLAHEHFHEDCQADIKISPDEGYVETKTSYWIGGKPMNHYFPDSEGRSPGALLYFGGYPNGWEEREVLFNISRPHYILESELLQNSMDPLSIGISTTQSSSIDQRSIMLYTFETHLLRNGGQSACVAMGDGILGEERFATELSELDIKYFQLFYN